MDEPKYIHIRNWERFQHYKDRNPNWIKNYTELLHDHNYLALPPATQALLHKLWLLYAATHRRIPLDTRYISRTISQRVTKQQLELLNQAGFITLPASNALALARSREVRTYLEKENQRTSSVVEGPDTQPVENHDDDGGFDLTQLSEIGRELPR